MSPAARTPDEISAEIADTRDRLAGTIDQLLYRTKPKTIMSRQVASTKASFFTDSGSLDTAKVGKIAAGVVGLIALVVVIRKIAG